MTRLNDKTKLLNDRVEVLENTIQSDKLKYQTFIKYSNHQLLTFLVNDVK